MDHIREEIQENLDDYVLKTDMELMDMISYFGCGELEFHTADIERLYREKRFLEERVEVFTELTKQLKERADNSYNQAIDDTLSVAKLVPYSSGNMTDFSQQMLDKDSILKLKK